MKIDHIRLCMTSLVIICVVAWTQVAEGSHFWLTGWGFRQRLTVKAEPLTSDLTNFPVLVRLNATNFDFQGAHAQGNDVQFALPDGTLLAHDRERHDSVNQDALYWVRLPSVSATQDTVFHLYYSKADAVDATNSFDVWTANYVGVWHMNDANGTNQFDASSNKLHGRVNFDKHAEPLAGEGIPAMIGGGVWLEGASKKQFITTVNTSIDTTQGLTFSAWAKPHSYGAQTTYGDPVIQCGGGNWSPGYFTFMLGFLHNTQNHQGLVGKWRLVDSAGAAATHLTVASGFSTNVWHHVASVCTTDISEGVTNTVGNVYIDGKLSKTISKPGHVLLNQLSGRCISIGANTHNAYPGNPPNNTFDGMLDEVRVAKSARSDAWIKASYLNQKPVDELLLVGASERRGTCLVIR